MTTFFDYCYKLREKIFEIYSRTLSQFISTLFPHQVSILFLGIDNAGKTTLLNLLKDTQTSTRPTNHPTSTEIEVCNMKANIFDLGGHAPARIVWKKYFWQCDGVVFIIDAVDKNRFNEVFDAFECVRQCIEEKNKVIPISVLINKMDKVWELKEGDQALVEEYCENLLKETGVEQSQSVKVTFVSMLTDDNKRQDTGIYDSFTWLKTMVVNDGKKDL